MKMSEVKEKTFIINGVFKPFEYNKSNLKIEKYGKTYTIKYKGETVGFLVED